MDALIIEWILIATLYWSLDSAWRRIEKIEARLAGNAKE